MGSYKKIGIFKYIFLYVAFYRNFSLGIVLSFVDTVFNKSLLNINIEYLTYAFNKLILVYLLEEEWGSGSFLFYNAIKKVMVNGKKTNK